MQYQEDIQLTVVNSFRLARKLSFSTLGVAMMMASLHMNEAFAIDIDEVIAYEGIGSDLVILGGTFNRPARDSVGVFVRLGDTVRTETGERVYNATPGDELKWQWLKLIDEDSTLFSEFFMTYVGGAGNCWHYSNGETVCYNETEFGLATSAVSINQKCALEKDFEMRFLFNGNQFLSHPYRPVDFKPKIESLSYTDSLMVTLRNESPENTEMEVIIVDDFDCDIALGDIAVEIETTIGDTNNGHLHFMNDEPGTGDFLESEGVTRVKTNTQHERANSKNDEIVDTHTKVMGRTDASGRFTAVYEVGEYSLEEKISVRARRKYEDKPDVEAPAFPDSSLTISFDDLVELTADADAPVTFADSGSCPHDDTHFLAPDTLARVKKVAVRYYAERGVMLSVNDASLRFGGVIDDKLGNRLTRCHRSHRQGIDIDINNALSGGIDDTTMVTINGTSMTSIDYVNRVFASVGMRQIRSAGLHWRAQ